MGQGYINKGRAVIEVNIMYKQPTAVLEIVQELRSIGLKQGQDFDFAYHKEVWDGFSSEPIRERQTVFIFYQEELATWFTLKYQTT